MIQLIKAYQYDNSYDYVKMFSTKTAQDTYFNSLNQIYVEDHNYLKVNNTFNVEYEFDYLENEGINYIIFDNGYREIFAFIIKKEFIRKNLTRLIYEVDVLQTYMFNFSVGTSFIERKACTINEVSEYDEGLNIGEHKIISETVAFTKGEQYFAMFNGIKNFEVTVDVDGKITHYAEIPSANGKVSTVIDGINYPLAFMPLSGNIPSSLSDHPSLVGIVRFPTCTYATTEIEIPYLMRGVDIGTGVPFYMTVNFLTNIATTITSTTQSGSGGSVAKNEVVDFYPYTYYVLTDGEGEPLIMKPQELGSSITVNGKYALSHQPIERFYVSGFKGDTDGQVYNITNANQMMLPTASSEGMAYISANGGNLKMQRDNAVANNVLSGVYASVGAVATIGTAIATGGASLALSGGAIQSTLGSGQSMMNGINQVREADQRLQSTLLTPSSISSYGTPSTRKSFGNDNVRVLKYSVSDVIKEKIRNFNLRFGNKFNNYATIDVKSYKGYIKYISPDIDSNIDNIYINKIREILERGVKIE